MQVAAHLLHALVQDVHAGDIQLDLGHAGKVGSGVLPGNIIFQTAQFGNVLQDRHKPMQCLGQGRIAQHIRKGLVAVRNHGGVGREEIRKRGALRVEDFQHPQLLERIHINVGDIDPRQMIQLGLAVGVQKAEVFQFHAGILYPFVIQWGGGSAHRPARPIPRAVRRRSGARTPAGYSAPD